MAVDMTVRVQWLAESEKVNATTDNAMLVLPEGPDAHRMYWSGTPAQQARMLAVCVDYMIRSGLTPLVQRILKDNEDDPGDLRGHGEPVSARPVEEAEPREPDSE